MHPCNSNNRNSNRNSSSNSSKDHPLPRMEIYNRDLGGHNSNEGRSSTMGGHNSNMAGSSREDSSSSQGMTAEAAIHDLHQTISNSSNKHTRLSTPCSKPSHTLRKLTSSNSLHPLQLQHCLHSTARSTTRSSDNHTIKRHPTHPHLCTLAWTHVAPDGTAAPSSYPVATNPARRNFVRLTAITDMTHQNAGNLMTHATRT